MRLLCKLPPITCAGQGYGMRSVKPNLLIWRDWMQLGEGHCEAQQVQDMLGALDAVLVCCIKPPKLQSQHDKHVRAQRPVNITAMHSRAP